MITNTQIYPTSSQSFESIRERGLVYVDKTDMIYDLCHGGTDYVFLSRPRRFGKSLLLDTMKAYFEGRKELFEGLKIEKLEKEWTKYAVFHFSMSTAKHVDKEQLESELNVKIVEYERIYGKREDEVKINQRFFGVVKRAYEQTGEKVVILIDEYDAPLLDVVHEEENLPILRKVMRNFYSPLKDLAPYLRFVFLTGITKFSQLSIFSELNNIRNISMHEKYATICGITQEELETQMRPGVECLAEKEGITYDEMLKMLKQIYDGYHFTWPSPDIYNPYSLLNALDCQRIENYWFGSGTPTYLIEMLRKFEVSAENIGGFDATSEEFDTPTEQLTNIVPLLYQSGYITIKDSLGRDFFTLDIPNREVRVGLMKSLLPHYVTTKKSMEANGTAFKLYRHFLNHEVDDAMKLLQKFLSTVPYTDNTNHEGNYQSMMYVILTIIGCQDVDIEVRTKDGRVDMVLNVGGKIYILEMKFDGSAQEALEQINIKNYPERFALYNLPVVKIGVNFSSETRTLTDWCVEEEA